MARSCADLLIGGTGSARSRHAWAEVYRSLQHGVAKSACEDRKITLFPPLVQDFATKFVEMQQKRHRADYDPDAKFYKSDVIADIDAIKIAIDAFLSVDVKDRRAFASWVLFKNLRRG